MAILSDSELRALLDVTPDLIVPAMDDRDTQVQPASIDLRLGRHFLLFDPNRYDIAPPAGFVLDLADPTALAEYGQRIVVEEGDSFVLPPRAFALATTLETVHIPANYVGRLEGRSSFGRVGQEVHSTAGFIDPGFRGQITLELHNKLPLPVRFHPGSRVCQLTIETVQGRVERPYGHPSRRSKYQGQQGATSSRLGFENVESVADALARLRGAIRDREWALARDNPADANDGAEALKRVELLGAAERRIATAQEGLSKAIVAANIGQVNWPG